MLDQLLLIALLVLAAYAVGYRVGYSDGRVAAMRWWKRVGRIGQLMQAAAFDEPGNPRLN